MKLGKRYKEVCELVQSPDLVKDAKKYKDTMREHGHLTELCYLYDEYKKVLSRDKFHFPQELQEALINRILNTGLDSERIHFDEIMPDEDDRVFYEVTLSRNDAFLVTGNQRHFPVSPIVVTPAEMLEMLK